jgi:hypothetical protein
VLPMGSPDALRKYGEQLDIRGQQGVRSAFYEGNKFKPAHVDDLKAAVNVTKSKVPEVEVLFQ